MNKLNKISSTLTLLVMATLCSTLLSACSGGFDSATGGVGSAGNSGQSNDGSSAGTGGSNSNALDAVDMKGYSAGGQSDGSLVVDLDKKNLAIVLSVPITLSNLNMSLNISPPQYPDIQFYNYVDDKGMSRVAVRIPLKYVLRGVNFGNPSLLPNGETIPFLGGELPSTNVVINATDKSKVYLYIGAGAVAMYVSHPIIPEYMSFNYYIKNAAKTAVVGAVGIAKKTALGDGGFVLSTRIPASIAKVLDNALGGL